MIAVQWQQFFFITVVFCSLRSMKMQMAELYRNPYELTSRSFGRTTETFLDKKTQNQTKVTVISTEASQKFT